MDKGNDYTALYDLVASKVKVLICMGKDNRALHEAFAGKVPVIVNVSGMQECVQRAYQLAQKGTLFCYHPLVPVLIFLRITRTGVVSSSILLTNSSESIAP